VCAYQLSLRRPRGVACRLEERHRLRYQLSYRRPRGAVCRLKQRPRVQPTTFASPASWCRTFFRAAASDAPSALVFVGLTLLLVLSGSDIVTSLRLAFYRHRLPWLHFGLGPLFSSASSP
jgi:hypothetical protein